MDILIPLVVLYILIAMNYGPQGTVFPLYSGGIIWGFFFGEIYYSLHHLLKEMHTGNVFVFSKIISSIGNELV